MAENQANQSGSEPEAPNELAVKSQLTPIERLPLEIRREIIMNIPDLVTLRGAIKSCRALRDACNLDRDLAVGAVLWRHSDENVKRHALLAIRSREVKLRNVKGQKLNKHKRDLQIFLDEYISGVNDTTKYEPLTLSATPNFLRAFGSLQLAVEKSSIIYGQRVIYLFETINNLFPIINNSFSEDLWNAFKKGLGVFEVENADNLVQLFFSEKVEHAIRLAAAAYSRDLPSLAARGLGVELLVGSLDQGLYARGEWHITHTEAIEKLAAAADKNKCYAEEDMNDGDMFGSPSNLSIMVVDDGELITYDVESCLWGIERVKWMQEGL
ncbi:uncharacterized protein JN550_006581 [Neoarthrinium moseri]|uniref:uncharacterized protein n=1 Tax=Neoarthrinium moseri TaxID=1658444 RepID=UPI001FDCC4F8|nr:uncharacterized protein JN550_006581 [Neoarthrinium moseri]KAI1868093.1 hypothetical protein JN550_006581 [Neoarthrinium moseri]